MQDLDHGPGVWKRPRPSPTRIFLMNCRDYNGHKDVLFVMRADDFRIGNDNWQFISTGRLDGAIYTIPSGQQFVVHYDWSVGLMGAGQ